MNVWISTFFPQFWTDVQTQKYQCNLKLGIKRLKDSTIYLVETNHIFLSRNKQERKPRIEREECHQQSALANPRPDPPPSARSRISTSPLRREAPCTPWRKTLEIPCPWRTKPWREGTRLRRGAIRKTNRRSESGADRAA